MHEFLAQFAIVALAHLFAVMSPGPDFVVVSRNSLSHSRRIGIYTAFGVALGISVHVAYSLLGVGFLISKSIILFNVIKILGALYLLYLGYKMLKSKPSTNIEVQKEEKAKDKMSPIQATKNGFLVNVLNPKATLFFLALFTQVVSPVTPNSIKLLYGIEMMLMTFIWFAVVSYLFSNKVLKNKITKVHRVIDKFTGAVLILLGIKVFISK